MATMVWLFPQATVLTLSGLRALTQDGFKILSLWPKPNCPNSLLPNVNKRPVWVTTAVCSSPQDMATRKEKDQITGPFRQNYLFSFMLLNHNDLIKVWFIQVPGLKFRKPEIHLLISLGNIFVKSIGIFFCDQKWKYIYLLCTLWKSNDFTIYSRCLSCLLFKDNFVKTIWNEIYLLN